MLLLPLVVLALADLCHPAGRPPRWAAGWRACSQLGGGQGHDLRDQVRPALQGYELGQHAEPPQACIAVALPARLPLLYAMPCFRGPQTLGCPRNSFVAHLLPLSTLMQLLPRDLQQHQRHADRAHHAALAPRGEGPENARQMPLDGPFPKAAGRRVHSAAWVQERLLHALFE